MYATNPFVFMGTLRQTLLSFQLSKCGASRIRTDVLAIIILKFYYMLYLVVNQQLCKVVCDSYLKFKHHLEKLLCGASVPRLIRVPTARAMLIYNQTL